MISKKIENIIVKYFSRSASIKELEELSNWLEEKENRTHFESFIKLNYYVEYNLMDFDSEIEKRKILKRIKKQRSVIFLKAMNYAAAVIVLAASGYFLTQYDFGKKPQVVEINNDIPVGTDKATLTLEDGTNVKLEQGKKFTNETVSSDGHKIIYDSKNQEPVKKIAYNYLTIPRGGEFFIELADGTNVWLNADSQLKYPVKFVEGRPREVELMYGEAYFDVSSSVLHNGAKFRVKKDDQYIEVLGTEFNVKSYLSDNTIETVLVEGKVEVNINNFKEQLVPNQQLVFNKETQEVKVKTVDAAFETAWKTGILRFKGKSLYDISKIFERWYDIEFVFENEKTKDLSVTGAFKKYQNVEHALMTLKNLNRINYKIEENKIYIR